MITETMTENANKIAYLVKKYPDHKLSDIIALLQMPAIDINAALWLAVEKGFLSEPNKETGEIALIEEPEKWNFGRDIDELERTLLYAFNKLSEREQDLEQQYYTNWMNGYAAHNVIIATHHLLDTGELVEYELTNVDEENGEDGKPVISVYHFYTLARNSGLEWGRKQFKNQDEVVSGSAEPESAPDNDNGEMDYKPEDTQEEGVK